MVTLNAKDISMQTRNMSAIIDGSWRACITPGPNGEYRPDVIVCNPPLPTHIHLAEKLHVPLQIWFPMPWTKVCVISLQISNLYC
jgi:hypothetical protein